MNIYLTMAKALLKYQDNEGLWRQVLTDKDSFTETSCTAMFTYSLATGIRHRWLDKSYCNAAVKGWNGLMRKTRNGLLEDVCVGTDEGTYYNHYLDRPRQLGDFHGQAPLFWAAVAMLKLQIDP